jgi:Flp pilus assembly protein TadG
MLKRRITRARDGAGQAFMELAISLVFLLVLIAAVIDLGWALYTLVSLRDAAQEAAAYGAICPTNEAKIRERLRTSATAPINMDDIDPNNIEICIINPDPVTGRVCGAPAERGNSVRVTVTVQHKIMVPFLGSFIGDDWEYPLRVTVSDTILLSSCYE